MEAFGIYLLKSAVWLTGFTLVFLVFLRNERYFRLNRAYLLSGIFASVVFPFYTWHYAVMLPSLPAAEIYIPDLSEPSMVTAVIPDSPGMPFYWWLYIVGIAFLAFRMIWQTAKVIAKLRRNGYVKNGHIKLVRTPEYSASFSFFSFVFVNPSTSDTEMKEILNHESGHIQKRHWFDLLLVELLRIMQWFNPFAWVYAHLVRQNHEYLADEMALQRTSNPAIYRAALLNQMLGVPVISLANSFSYSLNKQRFKMMKKKIDSPFKKLKLLVVLPLMALIFYAFAKPEYRYDTNENLNPLNQKKELYYIEKDSVNVSFTNQFEKSDLYAVKAKLAEVGIEIDYTSLQFTDNGKLKQISAAFKYSDGSKGDFMSSDLGPTDGPGFKMKLPPRAFGIVLPQKEYPELSKFLILVETTNEGIKLTSKEGCAWKELSYNIPGSQSQAIDQYGMTKSKTKEESTNSGFLFTIKKTEEGLSFEGIKGTAWKNLTFTCFKGNCHQFIDQHGMTTGKIVDSNLQQKAGKVKGKVTAEDGKLLQGAAVVISGTTVGTVTDAKGKFALKDVPPDAELQISYVGLKTAQVKPDFKQTMNITLDISTVAIGTVRVGSGEPPTFKIRGIDSENPPVIMLDGRVIDNSEMKMINPNDIDNISVFKDKSATEKYGEQGKNGVIFITTKNNKSVSANNIAVGKNLYAPSAVGFPGDQKVVAIGGSYGKLSDADLLRSIDLLKSDAIHNERTPMYVMDGRILDKGEIMRFNQDEISSITVLKDKSAIDLYGEKGKNGVIIITSKQNTSVSAAKNFNDITVTGYAEKQKNQAEVEKEKNPAYSIVEQMPQFPGGERRLMYFLSVELKYPPEAKAANIEGTVVVNFLVSTAGKIENVKVIKSVNPALDAEAVRVVGSMPDWSPGKQNGKSVDVYYSIPIEFSLKSTGEKSQGNSPIQKGNQEVVVVGYGTSRTGAQQKISVDSLLISLQHKDDAEQPVVILDNRVIKISEIRPDDIAKIGILKNEFYIKNYGEKAKNGVVIITSKQEEQRHIIDGEQAFVVVEQMPQFPGGENAMREFIQKTLKYPEEAKKNKVQATVLVNFVIDKEGKIRNPKVIRSSPELNDEALRVLNSMPAWIPGKQGGKPVPVSYTLPIKFALN